MKHRYHTHNTAIALLFVLLLVNDSGFAVDDRLTYYRVTIDNFSEQVLSAPLAVTHQGKLELSRLQVQATAKPETVIEESSRRPMYSLLSNAGQVTEVIDIGEPLVPQQATTFRISARPGNRLSLATMVDCSNNAFTGLKRARLPKRGAEIIWAAGYDVGTGDSTVAGKDMAHSCSGFVPVSLTGDSDIQAIGDMNAGGHGWKEPVAKITITHVAADATSFLARLSGAGVVPPVDSTHPWGQAGITLNDHTSEITYRLRTLGIDSGVLQASIHQGLPDNNGPVVAILFESESPDVIERLNTSGRLKPDDLIGPLAGNFESFVDALREGELYINVRSNAYPRGEIRGQVGAK